MTRSQDTDSEGTDTEGHSADDEGIEKDAGEEPHHCTFREVVKVRLGTVASFVSCL
jgi:hypothetical protein